MSLPEERTVTFKLFVFKNQNPTEIRKFNLKSTEIFFEKIEEILLDIFPNLKELKYKLLWKDQEDFITFSTAKEFSVFRNHVTKTEANEEMEFFINFEDELFAASKMFEQCRMVNKFTCNKCHNNIPLTCLNCTMSKSQQEEKIVNVTKNIPVQSTFADENCEAKASTTSDGFNEMNSAPNALSGKIVCNTLITKSNTFSETSSTPVPASYVVGSSLFGTTDFGKNYNQMPIFAKKC